MQVQLETFLHKQWDRKGLISWLLLPASAAFLSMAASRRRKTIPVKVGVPVVVVGNIYVGGTGKTPVTIALVKDLKERGWNPGIISAVTAVKQNLRLKFASTVIPTSSAMNPC